MFWLKYATAPSRDNKTSALARFWMGSYLRKLKILKPSLKCPVSFNLPPSIFLLEFLQKYDLEGQDVTVLTKAKMLVSLVQDWEKVSPVPGLQYDQYFAFYKEILHLDFDDLYKLNFEIW